MINYRLPGNAAKARAFGGGLSQITPGPFNTRNAVANRILWNSEYASFPVGVREGALIWPMKDGGIAVRFAGTSTFGAAINGLANGAASLTGAASVTVPAYGLTGLRQAVATLTGAGSVSATINGLGGLSATINVSQLTSQDVNGAVLDALIENGVTLKQALRLLLAVAAGKTDIDTSGPNPIVTFRDVNDTKDRIVATMTGSERTTVTKDVT